MGKFPPSLRPTKLPSPALQNPPSLPSQPPSSTTSSPNRPYLSKKTKKHQSHKTLTPTSSSPKPNIFHSSDLSSAKKIFDSILSSSSSTTSLNLRHHNSLLQSFSHLSSSIEDSFAFLHHMIKKRPSFTPDHSTYHILLSQSCKSDSDSALSLVRKTLDQMQTNGCPPDEASVDVAIRSLCSVGLEDDAIELVKEFSSKYTRPDTFTYNFLIKHLCKARSLSAVYAFIQEMKGTAGIQPDRVTYTILIDNVCNSKNLREITFLLGVLGEAEVDVDCYLYNTIMKGYCILNRGGEVLGVYKKMMEKGVEPDLVTFNTMIFGLSKAGRVEEAKKYLRVMADMGRFPDTVTYTSLMNGMCRKGNALGALALLKEMEDEGCTPNSCTYNTLLQGLSKSKLVDRGMEFYGVMKSAGMKLESSSYTTFVRALCRDGKVAEAYKVFDYAVESKSLTDVLAYSALESELKWLKKAKEQGQVFR